MSFAVIQMVSQDDVLANLRTARLLLEQAAAAGAQWSKSFYQILTEQPGKDAWPLTGATFILMHKAQDKPEQAASTLKFFSWAYKNGDQTADALDYVPMPPSVIAAIQKSWGEIKDGAGKPVAFK